MPERKDYSIPLGPGCSVFRVGKRWHIRFYDPEQRPPVKKKALRTADRNEAIRRGEKLYHDWRKDLLDPWRETIHAQRLEQALDRYEKAKTGSLRASSMKDILWIVPKLAEHAGLFWLDDVTPRDIHAFVYQPHLAQATRRSYYRRLNVFFGWCVEAGLLQKNPCERVDKPRDYQPLPHVLTETELDHLLWIIEDHVKTCKDIHRRLPNELWARDAFDLMAATGLRPSELRRLRWGDVRWPRKLGDVVYPGALHVRPHDGERTKNDKDRLVTMLPRAERRLEYLELETRRTSDTGEHVLKAADGMSAISKDYISRRFRYFREKAGLPKEYDLYSLRHFFGTEYVRRGGTPIMLQKEMGHKDFSTTQKYIHVADEERLQASYALFA